MKKIFLMFGKLPDGEMRSQVFEALLEGKEVRLILPKATYPSCSLLARMVDATPYIVEGYLVNKDPGFLLMEYPKIIEELRFDKEREIYICDAIPVPYNVSKEQPKWKFWEYFKSSMYASFRSPF